MRSKGDPVLYVKRPGGVDVDRQRDVVDAVQQLNQLQNTTLQDPEITTRISQYEMAISYCEIRVVISGSCKVVFCS